jgi:arsenate reductase
MKLLFICTHNRCRSILAEAITNFYGGDNFVAKSAGSQPVGQVHPLSLKFLQALNIPTENLCSQSWDEHESWQPDIVITVCDTAAGEPCPAWFGQSLKVHWGLTDPSSLDGSDSEISMAFHTIIERLKKRIERLVELGVQNKSGAELLSEFKNIEKLY